MLMTKWKIKIQKFYQIRHQQSQKPKYQHFSTKVQNCTNWQLSTAKHWFWHQIRDQQPRKPIYKHFSRKALNSTNWQLSYVRHWIWHQIRDQQPRKPIHIKFCSLTKLPWLMISFWMFTLDNAFVEKPIFPGSATSANAIGENSGIRSSWRPN